MAPHSCTETHLLHSDWVTRSHMPPPRPIIVSLKKICSDWLKLNKIYPTGLSSIVSGVELSMHSKEEKGGGA